MVADYSRSSPQAKGPINATLGVATGAVYNGLLHTTDPTIPKNSGAFRPIRVVAPPGRVTNVDYPGPLVAEHHRRMRAGQGTGQVEHEQVGERSLGHVLQPSVGAG